MKEWMIKVEDGEMAKDQDGSFVVFWNKDNADRDAKKYTEINGKKCRVIRKPKKFDKIMCRLVG